MSEIQLGRATDGFTPAEGYRRLHAQRPVRGDPLEPVEGDAYGPLLAEAYRGLWGHKHVDPACPLPTDGSVVLGLREDEYVGLCRLWPVERLVDQPGVIPGRRTPARKARLLAAACAYLGEGPVDVDTWGEDADSLAEYEALGFVVTGHEQGWELRL
jgi:hypothetical protein